MSEGKLASQVGHVTKELGRKVKSNSQEDIIVVLGLSLTKFKEKLKDITEQKLYYVQLDLGFTEVQKGTITVFGYIDGE
jgi:peptidyl-tRNA hydrolase